MLAQTLVFETCIREIQGFFHGFLNVLYYIFGVIKANTGLVPNFHEKQTQNPLTILVFQ